MLSIGPFSQATSLSVKMLRFYHEKGILVPARVEVGTGYRYYDDASLERAHVISGLRALDFSIAQISEILASCDDEADILEHLERQKHTIAEQIRDRQNTLALLETVINTELEARRTMSETTFEVVEKTLEPILIAGVRMKGKYSDCGIGFKKIGKALGRYIAGKPFCLYYDGEYREDDADLEACMPLKREQQAEGVSVRELPGGRCLSLLHKGPYEEIGRSYEKILKAVEQRGYEVQLPTREVYLKGPGMIFRGNPKKYLTEIQIVLKDA